MIILANEADRISSRVAFTKPSPDRLESFMFQYSPGVGRSRPSKNESDSSSALRGRLFPRSFVFRRRPSKECTKRYPQFDPDRPGSIDTAEYAPKNKPSPDQNP